MPRTKAVVCIDENKTPLYWWSSQKEAASALDISHYCISDVCIGRNQVASGLYFRYAYDNESHQFTNHISLVSLRAMRKLNRCDNQMRAVVCVDDNGKCSVCGRM